MPNTGQEAGPRSPSAKLQARLARLLTLAAAFLAAQALPVAANLDATQPLTPERVGTLLETETRMGAIFAAIRVSYPREYREFLQRLTPVARRGDAAEAERMAFAFSSQLMTDHFDGLARARDAELHEIARGYAAFAGALRRTDVPLCAQWFMIGFRPGSRPAAEATPLLVRLSVLQIAASRSGESQSREPRLGLSEGDSERLFGDLAARSPAVATLFGDDTALNAAPPERQCEAAVTLYETIAGLPAEIAANVTIHLLRGTFGTAAPAR